MGAPAGLQSDTGSKSTWTATVPTGLADGDYWVITFTFEGNDGPADLPSGFTALHTEIATGDFGGDVRLASFYKLVSDASSESNISVTADGGTFTKGVLFSFRIPDADGTTFLDVAAATDDSQSGTSVDAPTITPVTANATAIIFCAVEADAITATPPSGYTEFADASSGDSESLSIHYEEDIAASATGAKTVVLSASDNALLVHFAVRPGGGGAQALTGSTFAKAPTFGAGSVAAGAFDLVGSTFSTAPVFAGGLVSAGAAELAGTIFGSAPTFPVGAVGAGTVGLTGSAFQRSPSFSAGAIGAGTVGLSGVAFVSAPSFAAGSVSTGALALTGSTLTIAPTFGTGTVGAGLVGLVGSTFIRGPTFPTGTMSATATLIQEGFRWRNDDGGEAAATWKAAQDTNISGPKTGDTVRLRVLIDADADPDPADFRLEYRKVGDPTWRQVR